MLNKLTIKGTIEGPHLLVSAGVHGDEYEPMEACRRIYREVFSQQRELSGTLTLVPVVNMPAFKAGERTGPDGLDLARVCPGSAEGSETEKIAWEVSKLIRAADFYIDMHNGGRLKIIYPFSGYVLHPNRDILEVQRMMAKSFLLPIVWGTDPTLDGRTLSVARDAAIPAIYTEIGGAGIYDESLTVMAIEGVMNVMRALDMLPEETKSLKIKYHLEDHRKNSGDLHRLLSSPIDGFYIPSVSFGQHVEVGDLIGTVQDPSGKRSVEIKADQAGIIFILRSTPSVKAGDSLGGILPVIEDDEIQIINE